MKSFGKLSLFCFLINFNLLYADDVEFYFYPNEFAVGEQAKLEVKPSVTNRSKQKYLISKKTGSKSDSLDREQKLK